MEHNAGATDVASPRDDTMAGPPGAGVADARGAMTASGSAPEATGVGTALEPGGSGHEASATAPGAPAGDVGVDPGVLDAIEEELADVERALARLDDGTYGSCEVCGVTLDDEMLVRSPAARLCPAHLPRMHV